MIKEITKEQAIELLAEGKAIYVFDEVNGRFGNLLDVLDERLVADVDEDEPQTDEEGEDEEPIRIPLKTADAEPVEGETKTEKKTRGRKSNIDWGKVGALRKAGWSVPKIADEMGIGQSTIFKHFSEHGDPLKKG